MGCSITWDTLRYMSESTDYYTSSDRTGTHNPELDTAPFAWHANSSALTTSPTDPFPKKERSATQGL